MNKRNLLSKAEMRKVMGGDDPVTPGETCEKSCECEGGVTVIAKIDNCDKDTCDTSGPSAHCKVGGVNYYQSCATVCQ